MAHKADAKGISWLGKARAQRARNIAVAMLMMRMAMMMVMRVSTVNQMVLISALASKATVRTCRHCAKQSLRRRRRVHASKSKMKSSLRSWSGNGAGENVSKCALFLFYVHLQSRLFVHRTDVWETLRDDL